MDLENAYAMAVQEINDLALDIMEEFREGSGGMMSMVTAKEMAEKKWLYGSLYALKHKKRIMKPKK